MADEANPTAPKRTATPSRTTPAGVVYLDYLGAPDREGHRRPGHKIAPIVAGAKTGKLPLIVIQPGLTLHAPADWSAHCPPPKAGVKAKPGLFRALVDGGHLVVLEELPTDAVELLELATRTQCPDALQVLIDHEAGRKGGGKDKKPSRARVAVLAALKARKATVVRRTKFPHASGPRLRGTAA